MSCSDICLHMDFDGSNAFYREDWRKAGKQHVCCECRAPIAKGELHEYATGKTDGDFWAERTCAACVEIRQAFSCGSWVFTMLWETIREEMFPYWNEVSTIDCLAKLTTPEAIAKCRAMYADWQEDRDS